jgi:N12 class adenine-specific DNA methylase
MIIHEFTSEPFQAMVNNMPQTVRQHLQTFKIDSDDTMKELSEEMAKGRDIVFSVPADGVSYVIVRELIPVKIAMPGNLNDIGKPE